MNTQTSPLTGAVPHVIKGEVVEGADEDYGRFRTPRLDLDALVWPRCDAPPAADVPVAEIIDILVQLGDWIGRDPEGALERAMLASAGTNPLERGVLERSYGSLPRCFERASLEFQVEQELGGADVLDGWREVRTPYGTTARIRAFPPRLIHIVAGNAPGVTAMTVARGALTKGVHLLKLPSNDLYTASAVLRGLSAVAPGHPLSRSFSAAYWRGGDRHVESMLFRPIFFDKLVAWGGESALRSAKEYIGPGFELVAFDPKTSISMIGREVHASDALRAEVADKAAADATVMDQQACCSSRFQFVEGSMEEVEAYAAALQARLGVERAMCSACTTPPSGEIREEIEALEMLEPDYKVFGTFDGRGIVIRSEVPVDFYPDGKVVNVVRVDRLEDAILEANVATQTVGVFPESRRRALRNVLAAQGVQRVTAIGSAGNVQAGLPHDGFLPLQRFIRWVNDED
ncbi:acyl-CoA reductase [Novosphingobium malaysiense]|uniref:Long-chain-fatty-acyl-CoA reductase n=1 Tax=Novosphingobium malaysiense TaxID=1348853 RepID=A0A0B1ZIM2_9SPHN|nr:acyl-CoA reductase [Novosphingobium malaysiense]KHK89172.1 long-chain-fatty-acyl-CoA reductase [Novosphingobium malaysiense]